MKKQIKCPNCGDVWEYAMIVEHGGKKAIVTKNYDFIEDNQECTCFKCHTNYQMKITNPSDMRMDDFIYNVWRHCKL